jgi:subtilisin family serine protease
MVNDRLNWLAVRRAALLLIGAMLPLAALDTPAVHAQSIMRTPSISVGTRIPTITPTIAPRINPNIAGAAVTGIDRTSPNLRTRQGCSAADRDSGDCSRQSAKSVDGGGGGSSGKGKSAGGRRNVPQTAVVNANTVANEIVAELEGAQTEAQTDALARRHGLVRLQSQDFPLVGATIGLFRITDRRSVETVSRELATDAGFRAVQPNFRYLLQDQNTALAEGDAAQYALAKLRLPEAHTLAHGNNIIVAVIDSGIDVRHPELANSILASFDALGSKEGPHFHGTAIAGAIVAHKRLMGAAPAAHILAIRAFGAIGNGEQSTSFVVLKGLDYAAAHGAQIVNMSFAGPKDALIERGIAALAAKGIVMVAAAGNAGAKSPPLYPAADANVIAVSATDAEDKLFAASNRGGHIAVAAPGAEIFLPVPDEKYQMISGTSFSAAYVSGIAALMLERNPALKPDALRTILTKTARDLGAPGRDDLFGFGEADAYAAVAAIGTAPAMPVAAASDTAAAAANAPPRPEPPATRALNRAAPAMASDKPASGDASRAAAQ